MRKCITCDILKTLDEYPSSGYNYKCKSCVNEASRKRWAIRKEERKLKVRTSSLSEEEKLKQKERSKKYYESIKGRAATILKGVNDRTEGNHELTQEWLEEELKKGKCSVTGIAFDFCAHPVYKKNPFSPSIDRIDSSKGYTIDNSRLVIWQYNMGKAESTDIEFYEFCKSVYFSQKEFYG